MKPIGFIYLTTNLINGKIQTIGKLFSAMITDVLNQVSAKISQMYTCFFDKEA